MNSTHELLLVDAYRLLSRRPQSEKELRTKFQQYGYKKKIEDLLDNINYVVEQLKKEEYIDDKKFADWYVSQRQDFRPRSKRRLTVELTQKGISDEIIEIALEGYNEELVLKKLIEKKKEGYSTEELINYLLGQGFPYDLIKTVL
ncbi:MAG: Regulatory protein RecX [Candidatus Roizmanbacteria bacterium GW2011_GWC2_41_7]|uniref:Regulatory protein RecX n=1 Tax=Candidatus Roizmanbacteria bacterium GW2011_GWC2_41_7 TaxID=1618487 RepID=A0A0G0ZLJ5_9BACT|nr:MAG: Regulatory protein RecX [Candidatus Roizmanbacteria bacterium GW2011_GWC2_41_7]